MPNIIRIIQLILPWISIIFLPKKSFKLYLPVSLFASLLVTGMCLLAVPYKWWVVKGGWKVKLLNDGSFILGPFLVGTLWIFHLTFGNLKRYLGLNLIMDILFSFPLSYLFQKLRLFKLVNFRPKHIFFSFITFALVIYGYQLLIKRIK
ncbi:hypothetical protein SAMN05192533_12023 [Mesobacillus persicus]|uniref:Uncharacterized protein n=1 Tax=Mesobacillus persicus TaxID=930146 RepID=A0A1H8J919_9BACI|nr:hypothetical protein [Mesobacillus persicus]SEN76766.1 hypothetical protein SAMN05192533_12023 [Mesobacillus persicus]